MQNNKIHLYIIIAYTDKGGEDERDDNIVVLELENGI